MLCHAGVPYRPTRADVYTISLAIYIVTIYFDIRFAKQRTQLLLLFPTKADKWNKFTTLITKRFNIKCDVVKRGLIQLLN